MPVGYPRDERQFLLSLPASAGALSPPGGPGPLRGRFSMWGSQKKARSPSAASCMNWRVLASKRPVRGQVSGCGSLREKHHFLMAFPESAADSQRTHPPPTAFFGFVDPLGNSTNSSHNSMYELTTGGPVPGLRRPPSPPPAYVVENLISGVRMCFAT